MRLPALVVLHLAALAVGTYAAFRPTLDSNFARMQTDPGDTVLNHYILEHTWRVVSDPTYPHTLWSPPFYYPTTLVMSYSENMLGVAPVYWGLRTVLPTDLAYQVWMMVLSGLNYAAMSAVLACVRIRAGERLPHLLVALGGFLWAFGLPVQAQLNHQQLIARFWMPAAAACAWQFARDPSARRLNRVFLFLFLQTLTCVNAGWFLTFGLGVFVPVAVWVNGTGPELRERLRRWRALGVVACWGMIFVAFLMPYFLANYDFGRAYDDCVEHMPTVWSLFAGPPDSRWYHTVRGVRSLVGTETFFFSGFGFYFLLLAAAVAVRARRHAVELEPAARLATAGFLAALGLLLLTLNYGSGVSAWWVLRLAPGGLGIRAVGRVQMVIYLFLIPAVLIGFTLWVQGRLRAGPARFVAFAVAVGVVAFEQTGHDGESFDKADVYGVAARAAERFRGADVAYYTIPEDEHPLYPSLVAMWAGMLADVPVVNGYSGRRPPTFPELERLTDADVKAWLGPAFRGKTLVVVDATKSPWQVRRHVLE